LGEPATDIIINSLGKNSKNLDKKIASVTLLGSNAKIHWKQKGDALIIKKDFKVLL
jgi:alpha-L-fucosidase